MKLMDMHTHATIPHTTVRLVWLTLLALALLASACTGASVEVTGDGTDAIKKATMKDEIEQLIGIKRDALDAFDSAVEELAKDKPDLKKAEELLQKALATSPDFLEAQYNLGIVYERRGQFDKAIEAYKKAQTLDKFNSHTVAANLAVGRAQALADKTDEATLTFEETARLAPENIDVLNSLAAAYMKAGKQDDAIEYVKKVLREDNQNVTALNTLAQVYTQQKNQSMAIYVFKKAARVALGAVTTDEELQAEPAVLVLTKKVDLKKAKTAIAADILNNLGMIYFNSGELPLAVANFNAASQLDPADIESRLNTGALLIHYLAYDKAKKLFAEALAVSPDNCDAMLGLAASNFASGGLDASRDGYVSYLDRCDAKFPTAHLQLEKIFERKQDFPNAIKHCEMYVQIVNPPDTDPVNGSYCKALENMAKAAREQPAQPEGGAGAEGAGGEGAPTPDDDQAPPADPAEGGEDAPPEG